LLERHLHAQPYGSLIQAIPSGVRNLLRYVHEQTIADPIAGGVAGLYRVAGSGAMHFVPHVKHLNEECEVPSFPESELLGEAEVGVE
jgi:hypothetical protein